MPETYQSPITMEAEHRNQNGGNLFVQFSHFVDGVDDQGSRKMFMSSSSSSSSSNSLLDVPFGEDDEEGWNKHSSHAVGGDDVQVSSKNSRSFSSKDDEKHGNLTMETSPVIGGVDFQVCRKASRSSSSSSSSADSLSDGHLWEDNEEHKNPVQSFPAVDGLHVQVSSKMSRSSFSSSSSQDSSLNDPFKEDDKEHRNTNSVNLMTQPFPAFDGLDVQASSKMSRSSSSSSSPESSLYGPFKEDDKKHRNTNGINSMMQSSPVVDGLDVQASSKMAISSSSSTLPDSSVNSPFKGDDEKHRKTNTGILVMKSSPAVDLVDVQVSSKNLRSSSSSSSSSSLLDSPLDDPFGENDKEFDKSSQTTTSLPGHNNQAKEPASRKSLPTYELPVSIPATEVKKHSTADSNLGNMPTTNSPPTQVMERPTNSKYRIPSHVFARTKSTNPVEWSVASNESLFSIHMGNTSFTRDQFFLRPDELGTIPGQSSTSGQMFNYSTCTMPGESSTLGHMFSYPANQPPGSNASDGKSHELPVDTVKKVLKENEDQSHGKSISEGRISHLSAGSSTSTKSFAFPILTDLEKGHSDSIDVSSRMRREDQQIESQKLSTPETPSQPLEQPMPKDPSAGTEFGFGTRWLSCMSCCTFCR